MSSTPLALSSPTTRSRAARVVARLRLHGAFVVALVTLFTSWGALILAHKPTPIAVPNSVALHRVLEDPRVARILASVHWRRFDVSPMDRHYEILGFYRGARMVASVTVGFDGKVVLLSSSNLTQEKYAYGSNIPNDLRVLAPLSALFVLVLGVWPLWRVRNLDVLAVASLSLSVVLYNAEMLDRMVLVTYPALIYLAFRCAWWALAPAGRTASSIPLYDHLTGRWTSAKRRRMLRWVALALVLITAMVGLSSPHVVDVGYAVMEGATDLLRGTLPYGHIPDVLHGDTYPIGSYLLYTPLAWLSPVHNVWDDADFTLVVAVLATVLTAGGVWWICRSCAERVPRSAADTRGLRAAVAILAFPPLLVTVSTGTTDVALAAMLVAAFALWWRPGWSTAVVTGAAWFKLAPLAVLPLFVARLRGRGLGWALAALAVTSSVMVGLLVALGGPGAPTRMLTAMGFQFSRSSPHTPWALLGSVPLQQLVEAATLALIAGAVVRLRRDPALAGDRVRIAALAAAVLLGLQIAANYWNYFYLAWPLPLIVLSLLTSARAPVTSRARSSG